VSVEEAIIKILTGGGSDALLGLGWLLFLYERYHIAPRRETEVRKDLQAFREDYHQLAEKTASTLGGVTTVLEIIKDRIGRPTP